MNKKSLLHHVSDGVASFKYFILMLRCVHMGVHTGEHNNQSTCYFIQYYPILCNSHAINAAPVKLFNDTERKEDSYRVIVKLYSMVLLYCNGLQRKCYCVHSL